MVDFNRDTEYAQPTDNGIAALYAYRETGEVNTRFEFLNKAIESSYRGLNQFRCLNRNLIEAYAGPGYGESTEKRKIYLNKMHQAVDAYIMNLAANRPKVEIETKHRDLSAFAKQLETAVNNLLTEIGIEYTIRRWVLDAFFCVGIIKVHRKDSGLVELEPDIWMDPGNPFASNVSLDNFVFDTGARTWGEVKWAGDMYRVSMADIKEGVRIGMYDPAVAEEIKPTSKYWQNAERIESFSTGQATDRDEFEPMVDLADVWIRRENRIFTFVVSDRRNFCLNTTPLAVMEWKNPEHSPYHLLGFADVPENVMPVSPASHLDELHRLINSGWRKEARNAASQKTFTVYSPAGVPDAKRFQRVENGGMVASTNPQDVQQITMGGVHAPNMAFLATAEQEFDDAAGGLRTMLGYGASADTATQEQLIQTANNKKLGQMQYRVIDATRNLVKSLAFELWGDEFKTIVDRIPVEGADGYYADVTWKPGDREGNFIDYNLDINIGSMPYRPPQAQYQEFVAYLQNVIAPMMPLIEAQGGGPNMALINNKVAELLNMPWIKDVITFSVPLNDEEKPATSTRSGGKPANTSRTYRRISSSTGGTAQGQQQARIMGWMGAANSQQNGMANGRPAA